MLLFLTGIIAPALFWIIFFYYKDRFQPEPIVNLGVTYLLGFLFSFLCYKFYFLLQYWDIPFDISPFINQPTPYLFIYLTMITGIIEELFKLIPFVFVLKFFLDFDEPMDSIVYSSVIAIGFSSYENFIHIKYLSGFELYARAITTPLTHTIFASIWGYYIYKFLNAKKSSFMIPVIAFLSASLFHGVYDFFTFSPLLRIFSAILVLLIWIWRIILIEKFQKTYLIKK